MGKVVRCMCVCPCVCGFVSGFVSGCEVDYFCHVYSLGTCMHVCVCLCAHMHMQVQNNNTVCMPVYKPS